MSAMRTPLGVMALAILCSGGATATAPHEDGIQQPAGQTMQADNALTPQQEDRLIREVRHELLMLPYYGVFDDLQYTVQGRTVTLLGYLSSEHSQTKKDAERAVKKIEGVDNVVNNIEVLPPSPLDDRIRRQLYNRIYGYGPLFKYANLSIPPIHIVVKNGHAIFDGVVDTETDKNLVTMQAKQVPDVFSVTNNLQVNSQYPGSRKK